MGGWEHWLEGAADAVWGAFAGHEGTRDAAARMVNVRAVWGVGEGRLQTSWLAGNALSLGLGAALRSRPPAPVAGRGARGEGLLVLGDTTADRTAPPTPNSAKPSFWRRASSSRRRGWAAAGGTRTGEGGDQRADRWASLFPGQPCPPTPKPSQTPSTTPPPKIPLPPLWGNPRAPTPDLQTPLNPQTSPPSTPQPQHFLPHRRPP